jgi:hypothetical protein
MSKKHFSSLLIVTILVAAAVFLVPSKTGREAPVEYTELLPGFAGVVNDLGRVRVSKAGNEVLATLERNEEGWFVAEVSGYPADWNKLKALLAELSRARIVEAKTSNAEYYPRLGVEEVSSPDASGLLLELGEGDDIVAVIVGKAAQGRDGQYVRMAGVEQSLLVDREFKVPAETKDWLDRTIVDIPDGEAVEVEVMHSDGGRVLARKVSADDTDFVLQDIPEGREIQSNWSVNQMGGALSALDLDSVATADDIDWVDASRFRLLTADGLELTAELMTRDESRWMRLKAAAYTAQTDTGETSGDEQAGEESVSAADRAAEINARLDGWAYEIPQYKYDAMNKRMEDMLKAIEDS